MTERVINNFAKVCNDYLHSVSRGCLPGHVKPSPSSGSCQISHKGHQDQLNHTDPSQIEPQDSKYPEDDSHNDGHDRYPTQQAADWRAARSGHRYRFSFTAFRVNLKWMIAALWIKIKLTLFNTVQIQYALLN